MNVGIIGGDARIAKLVNLIEENGKQTSLYGLENCDLLKDKKHVKNLQELVTTCETIITSIPLSKDEKYINTTFTNKKILIEDFFNEVGKCQNIKIITGNITENIKKFILKNEVIDVLKLEELTVLNSIPTAEGAIQIAMENSTKTIHNSKCLVLGFGRIGKILSKMLLGIGAKVYCEARKTTDIAWIESYGYNAININQLEKYLNEFDFIFNTIPYIILNKENLYKVKKDCLIIDLASKPGGVDFEEANRLNLNNIWALALPGKVAPETSANYIYKYIKEFI